MDIFVHTYDTGIYSGEFKKDKDESCYPHGSGTFEFNNGDVYSGSFKDGAPSGYGTLTFANGNKHIGEFKDGDRNGFGTTIIINPYTIVVGNYESDFPIGVMTVTDQYSDIYVGEIKGYDLLKHGHGYFKSFEENGDWYEYEGKWINDKLDGPVKVYSSREDNTFHARFEDGQMIKTIDSDES